MIAKPDIQPIGLDLGEDSVKMLQIELVAGRPRVRAAARAALEDATALPRVIGDMLRCGNFAGRGVVAALPREILHIKNLRLPMIPAAELGGAIQFEARNVFNFDTDSAHVEFLAAGEVRQGTEVRQEVIVMAARDEDVEPVIQNLHSAGLVIESLDAEPCALYRTVERFMRRKQDEQEVVVLIEVGLRRTQVLIGRGAEIQFFKPIEVGGRRLNDSVSRKLRIEYEEALALRRRLAEAPRPLPGHATVQDPVRQAVFDATRSTIEELGREISLCLRYYSVTFRGQRPSRVRLAGGEAHDPNLATTLSAILSLPVEPARPLASVDTTAMRPADRRGPMSEWAVPLGLALKKTVSRFAQLDGAPRSNSTHPHVAAEVPAIQITPGESEVAVA